MLPLADWCVDQAAGAAASLCVGVQGGQGAGKSTVTDGIARVLTARGVRTVVFGLDDIYLTRAERLELSKAVHPLLATRTVPGTHDVALGIACLEALADLAPGETCELPVFDKAEDDRSPVARAVTGPVDLVLFEGWCVGLPPQPEARLDAPVNAFEATADADGRWRRYSNAQLAGPYAALWSRLHRLVVLEVPGLDDVRRWREAQEALLGDRRHLSPEEVVRFVDQTERWTRWALEALPARADLRVQLGHDHLPVAPVP